MTPSDQRITLKIDISAGTIELDAASSDFDNAIEKTTALAMAINLGSGVAAGKAEAAPKSSYSPLPDQESPVDANFRAKPRLRPGTPASSGRAGRIGSFEPMDLGLDEKRERSLRAFFEEKKPKEQVDQVAVAMYQGEKVLERKTFTYNEIYSIMRLAGIKDLPKALDVVLKKMIDSLWVIKDGAGFSLKFVGRDHVEKLTSVTADDGVK